MQPMTLPSCFTCSLFLLSVSEVDKWFFGFVDIGGIADHHYLNFFSQLNVSEKGKGQLYEEERKNTGGCCVGCDTMMKRTAQSKRYKQGRYYIKTMLSM
jgi:hypothetical protein